MTRFMHTDDSFMHTGRASNWVYVALIGGVDWTCALSRRDIGAVFASLECHASTKPRATRRAQGNICEASMRIMLSLDSAIVVVVVVVVVVSDIGDRQSIFIQCVALPTSVPDDTMRRRRLSV